MTVPGQLAMLPGMALAHRRFPRHPPAVGVVRAVVVALAVAAAGLLLMVAAATPVR